ncbi:MAG TPA: NUDIX domain-containing protein [Parachlamydiaceae bacterium]|nr:NUDIX domain-containing protein [Parachlamydiaceae bacterium]
MAIPSQKDKSSVAGVIFNADRSEVLLIKRRDVNIWVIPGGGVDPGEVPEAAMVREFAEETGLTVVIKRQVALFTPINRLTNYSYLFECSILKGELTLGDETQGIGFFPLTNLPDPLFFLHKDWIYEAKNSMNGIIQKPLSQITYCNLFKYFLSHPLQVLRIVVSRCGIPINTK